jgi:predicted  nucleic acid-binding Zn-ribbon protein
MPHLPILYRIQELDSRVLALKRTLEQAITDPNLLALQSLQQQILVSLTKIDKERKKVNVSQRRLELDLKDCSEHLKHEEEKLYNGTVMSSRGLEQVQQKATEYKNHQTEVEDQILVLLEADEKLSTEQTNLQKRLETCNQEIASMQLEIKQKAAENALEENEINFELEELRPQVPTEWLTRYQKIAQAHFGVGIAKIKTGSCGACHVGLSDSLLSKAKQGEDIIIFCENCGRILYFS